MIQFEYDTRMKRYNVTVPFTLAGETSRVTVAAMSEDNRLTLHRELRIELVRQILMHWDEYEHQITRELDELLDEPKNESWKDISIDEIEWLSRTWHIFNAAGIRTIGELVEYREVDLYRLKNCGRKTMTNIQEGLHGLGLTLKQ